MKIITYCINRVIAIIPDTHKVKRVLGPLIAMMLVGLATVCHKASFLIDESDYVEATAPLLQ